MISIIIVFLSGLEALTSLKMDLAPLWQAFISLPLAAVLGAILAFRIRQPGTPPRVAAVIHSQIILAVIGAMLMMVIGESLARAFGIVGIAGLIRYRVKIDDPKDAGVMLATLAIGLAAGAGLYIIAVFSTVFTLMLLLIIESFEPAAFRLFTLKLIAREAPQLRTGAERILKSYGIKCELHSSTTSELKYELHVPLGQDIATLINALTHIDGNKVEVEFKEFSKQTHNEIDLSKHKKQGDKAEKKALPALPPTTVP